MVGANQAGGEGILSQDALSYFVDALFRTNPSMTARSAPPAAAPGAQTPAAGQAAMTPSPTAAAGSDQSAHSPAGETPPSMALYGGVPGAATTAFADLPRAEASRILFSAVSEGALSQGDRTYLARVVAARTGIAPEEAERRVTDIQERAMERVRQSAESARRAGAYLSFWSFMALLFGAVAAVIGGVVGGEHRDQM
jgi:hypothetical protein